jgi:transcriptional regulator with XRE-family HTH domain
MTTTNDGPDEVLAWMGLADLVTGDQETALVPAAALQSRAAELGHRVKAARVKAGLAATELAQAVGLTKDKLSKIESGRRRVAPVEMPALASALGVSVAYLRGVQSHEPRTLALAHRVMNAAETDDSTARARAVQLLEVQSRLERRADLPPHEVSAAGAVVQQIAQTRFGTAPRTRLEAQRQGRLLAEEVRRALDLGTAEIGDLPGLIEMHFAADVALGPYGRGVTGLCVHSEGRALLLASTDFTSGHVRFTLAHELGHHLLSDPRDVIEETSADLFGGGFVERRVNSFAAHLLLPSRGLSEVLEWLDVSGEDLAEPSPRGKQALGYLMARYGISLRAALYQLRDADVITFARANQLGDELYATDLLAAAASVVPNCSQLAESSRETRVPVRLRAAALAAARNSRIGLVTVAALLDRPDDEDLYEEVLGDGSSASAARALKI